MNRYTSFPFCVNGQGRTEETGREAHIRQLIEQVLFTSPGERLNRPAFGANLMSFVFDPLSAELGAATKHMVHAALQEQLYHLAQIQDVQVRAEDATLFVTVQYISLEDRQSNVASFERGLDSAGAGPSAL